MSDEFITLELARIYESQGYFRDARDMYRALKAEEEEAKEGEEDVQARDLEITAGLQRMESALKKQDTQADPLENPLEPLVKALSSLAESREPLADPLSADTLPVKGINFFLEQWLMLLMLEKRVNSMKQLTSRAFGLTR